LIKFYPNNKEERDFERRSGQKRYQKSKKKTRAKDESEKENSRASRRDLNDFRQRNF
jgi:hypothetical protein